MPKKDLRGFYQDLRQLPKVSLQSDVVVEEDKDGQWLATVTLKNKTSVPALMIRLNVIGEKDSLQFLPIFYSDNYFSLLPGEEKLITIRWKDEDTRGNHPKVLITGYNVN